MMYVCNLLSNSSEKNYVFAEQESKRGKMFTLVNIGKAKIGAHFTILSLFYRISVFPNIKLGEEKSTFKKCLKTSGLGKGSHHI